MLPPGRPDLKNPNRSDVLVEQNDVLARKIAAGAQGLRDRKEVSPKDEARFQIRKTLVEPGQSDPNGFERIIGTSDLLSINFLDRGRRAADAVCRIRVPGEGGGWVATGFLVGPRLLITNNHVLANPADAGQAECEFGFEADLDGVLKEPVSFNLMPEELFFTDIAHDVTLVAVAPFSEGGVPLRRYGYLPLIPVSGKAANGEWVTIIQHPNGQPKQIAIRACQIVELSESGVAGLDLARFIHYTTDTEPGSSGAPVLNDQWQVVALHHRAIPAPRARLEPRSASDGPVDVEWLANEGVRVSAIYNCLEEKRFTSTGAAAALAQLERGIGVPPLLIASAEAQPGLEADRAPLALTSWKPGLGYDPAFLSVELTLDEILGAEKAAAATLKGSTAVALDYLHFSTVIHEKRKFAMLTAVNIDGARLVNPGSRSDTWRQDARIAAEYQPAGDFYEAKKGDDRVRFSRGHLVRRIDPCWGSLADSKLAEMHTFHYTNATPQVQHYNDVDWGNLEDYILAQIQTKEKKLTVFTGPIFRDHDPWYGRNRKGGPWQVPVSYWKVAVIQKSPEAIAAAAFIIGQTQYVRALYEARAFTALRPYSFSDLQTLKLQTTISTIEHETGLSFEKLRSVDSLSALESTRQTRFVQGPADIII